MELSKSGQQINLTTETTLLAEKTTDLSIVEESEPHCTTSAFTQHAIPAAQTAQTAQKKTIPSGTQQEQATLVLEQGQQHRPLSTNQIPGGGGEQETPFQQHSNKPWAQTPPPHHFQPPRTLIPENHPIQEQNETVKNSTEIGKPPRIHQQHLPKTTKKRSMPEPDPGTVPNPAKKLAYTCDLVWPVAANIGDRHFGKRLQKMFGETIDIVQQGLLRLEA